MAEPKKRLTVAETNLVFDKSLIKYLYGDGLRNGLEFVYFMRENKFTFKAKMQYRVLAKV